MDTHIKVVGILHVIFGAIGILVAVGFLLLFGGIAGVVGLSADHPDAAVAVPIVGALGTILFLIIGVISLPGLIGGIGLLKLAPWSRVLMIVISALELVNVPFGTALGIYGLWVLTRPESEAMFARRPYQRAAY
ncbi:MAG: hypothetical protein LAP87_20110 [Acidobacteriia bacterium]|nr:hypothetical protein [Terriglobia bacterium]